MTRSNNVFWITIFFSVLVSPSLHAESQDAGQYYPLPVAETKNVLSQWLAGGSFEVTQNTLPSGNVQMTAVKGNEKWQITLKPYSALASYILPVYTIKGQPDELKIKAMLSYLDNYYENLSSANKTTDREIPQAVLSRRDAVVCIKAMAGDKLIQFSGFFIDRDGTIIATAHDLEGIRDIVVIFNNGSEVKGKIKKMDVDSDLILIQIRSESRAFISLLDSRDLLENGEVIYSIGCPLDSRGKIQSGIINGLPRKVNNHALWQVSMDTQHGSSGSPVFDKNGNLAGVVKGRYKGTDSRGFVITIETVMDFLKD